MKFLRWLRCKLEIGHRTIQKWMTLEEAKLTPFQAGVWGCRIVDGKVNYFQCQDCKTIIAPFEARSRWFSS